MRLIERFGGFGRRAVIVGLVAASAFSTRADLLELINGDHYRGTVVSMTTSNVEFISEIQGRVVLPRSKVAQITFREVKPKVASQPVTNAPLILSGSNIVSQPAPAQPIAVTPSGAGPVIVQQMQSQGVDSKLVSQIQEQIFGKASPEAASKFNQMMSGVLTGQISVRDIRDQAQRSIDQIKAAKKDLGPDAGEMLDGYLDILQKFVQEANTDTTITGVTK